MNCLCKLRGEGAADCRNIHAYLFENAALHHAADAAAAFAGTEPLRPPIPRRFSEACIASVLTLDRFEFQDYAIPPAVRKTFLLGKRWLVGVVLRGGRIIK